MYADYAITFGAPPGHNLAGIIVSTSWEEVRGYLLLTNAKWLVLLLLAWTACYLFLALRLPLLRIFTGRTIVLSRAVLIASALACTYAVGDAAQLIDGVSFNPAVGSLMFLIGDIPRARGEIRGSRVHKIPYGARRNGGEEVHVLVVGESVRRDSWSVYGYGRATTPYLNTLKGEAIFLQDATADANLTEWPVPIVLTGMTPEAFSMGNVRGNLLDLAKEAGYSTTWLVNQHIGISTAVGVDADHVFYPADFKANINGSHTLDEVLLPAYKQEILRAGVSRFIGIHMMGSHWEYYRRYPSSFRRFGSVKELGNLSMISVLLDQKNTQSAVVDAYDNSIAYTDWFLQQIIEQARVLNVPASVVFFPDHGEDLQFLDGETGHGQPNYTQHAFEIPAFVWVNDAYRKAHPDILTRIRKNSGKEIRTHNVFYTVADIMGVEWSSADWTKSFASDRFVPDGAMKHVAGGVLVARSRGVGDEASNRRPVVSSSAGGADASSQVLVK